MKRECGISKELPPLSTACSMAKHCDRSKIGGLRTRTRTHTHTKRGEGKSTAYSQYYYSTLTVHLEECRHSVDVLHSGQIYLRIAVKELLQR